MVTLDSLVFKQYTHAYVGYLFLLLLQSKACQGASKLAPTFQMFIWNL